MDNLNLNAEQMFEQLQFTTELGIFTEKSPEDLMLDYEQRLGDKLKAMFIKDIANQKLFASGELKDKDGNIVKFYKPVFSIDKSTGKMIRVHNDLQPHTHQSLVFDVFNASSANDLLALKRVKEHLTAKNQFDFQQHTYEKEDGNIVTDEIHYTYWQITSFPKLNGMYVKAKTIVNKDGDKMLYLTVEALKTPYESSVELREYTTNSKQFAKSKAFYDKRNNQNTNTSPDEPTSTGVQRLQGVKADLAM